jgi:hypothetical protein
MKNNDKKEEINKILEDKFKYTNDILSDKIQKVFNDTIEDVDYYNEKQKDRLLLFKYSIISIPVFVIAALICHYIFKI